MSAKITLTAGLSLLVLATMAMVPPAFAQMDLTGRWQPRQHEDQPERGPGPELGDYLGLPLNDSARLFADSWDPARLTLPEHQCRVHTTPYIYRGPLNLRIWEERNPSTQVVEKIMMYIRTYEQTRTIYMDGRPHPNELAPHTWMGFSTGKWDGDALIVTTTHIKQNWVRRNGIPQSDRATLIVTYCQGVQCWGSYNAALRAVRLGYTNVHWYRGGMDAWRGAGLPLVGAGR